MEGTITGVSRSALEGVWVSGEGIVIPCEYQGLASGEVGGAVTLPVLGRGLYPAVHMVCSMAWPGRIIHTRVSMP